MEIKIHISMETYYMIKNFTLMTKFIKLINSVIISVLLIAVLTLYVARPSRELISNQQAQL